MVRYARRTLPTVPPWETAPIRRKTVDRVAVSSAVFTASWCRSVGTTWTVELRSLDRAELGCPVEWICSGVPTQQPAPERQTDDLLRERGLLLFPVDPAEATSRTRSRRLIGYVTRDPEVARLAQMLAGPADAGCDHPMILAARWVQSGYSADAAVRRITTGGTRGAPPKVGDPPLSPGNGPATMDP